MSGGAAHDQRRVVSPSQAVAAGARYIVLGRAVTAAPDPAAAMHQVLAELKTVAV
jgi:orotidine-5'-phosphate decarboxylase